MSKDKPIKVINERSPAGFILILAYIGAAVYFVNQSDGFWNIILALLKAIVWPAYVLYNVLEALHV